ncbi:hypothetical protein SELMODRAFT_421973 [Selaginella moellendorffii]|uniref:Bulb-type lectin domain-containing protein n=1 Tax=Selaginella moellendorffii TaxID=88036 RepID=D8SGY5_SELML|nr:hypothetical protein SELMODRAFT_421973 [Selaginella moellendorffii]
MPDRNAILTNKGNSQHQPWIWAPQNLAANFSPKVNRVLVLAVNLEISRVHGVDPVCLARQHGYRFKAGQTRSISREAYNLIQTLPQKKSSYTSGRSFTSWHRVPGSRTCGRTSASIMCHARARHSQSSTSSRFAWAQRPALDTANNPVRLLGDPDPDWGNCWPFRSSIIGGADEAVGSIIGRSATLVSPSGRYKARMQRDCNFVLYDTYRDTNKVVWASDTFGKGTGCYLIDANLVLLDTKGHSNLKQLEEMTVDFVHQSAVSEKLVIAIDVVNKVLEETTLDVPAKPVPVTLEGPPPPARAQRHPPEPPIRPMQIEREKCVEEPAIPVTKAEDKFVAPVASVAKQHCESPAKIAKEQLVSVMKELKSWLLLEFKTARGLTLDHQALGFAKLLDLMTKVWMCSRHHIPGLVSAGYIPLGRLQVKTKEKEKDKDKARDKRYHASVERLAVVVHQQEGCL